MRLTRCLGCLCRAECYNAFWCDASRYRLHSSSSSACGLVGYDACFTRRRSRVRSSACVYFFHRLRLLHARVRKLTHGAATHLSRGWMAERSKAPVSGTGLFGGVGSNPTPIKFLSFRALSLVFFMDFGLALRTHRSIRACVTAGVLFASSAFWSQKFANSTNCVKLYIPALYHARKY